MNAHVMIQKKTGPFALLILLVCLSWFSQQSLRAEAPVEAITFAAQPGILYVPLNEAAQQLHWEVARDEAGRCIRLHDLDVPVGSLRQLIDGSELIRASDLELAGAVIDITLPDSRMTIRRGFHRFTLINSLKRVEVNLAKQQLRGWQGSRLVLQTHISSGRNGRTPAGNFTAGPFRTRMHHSTIYHNAPMPWSVQIYGNVFIHGFSSVPDYPASHGCIRMPLDGGNPAKFFYEWIDNGSPVQVVKS